MKNQESEKALEASLVSEIKARGGFAIKLTSQFHRGLPDRLVLLPFHTISFVEVKTTGKAPTLLQYKTHEQLRKLGIFIAVVDSTEALNDYLSWTDQRITKMKEGAEQRRKAIRDGRE